MSRTPRHQVVLPGLPHHVILRANNRRNLFSSAHDRAQLLRFMLDAPNAQACLLHALALMTNHAHLVVTPPGFDELWRWIKSFAQRYAIHRNRERAASGKVFEQRYGLVVIRQERQLAATTAYVDLNATRAGISSRWTTLGLHGGHGDIPTLVRELWRPSSWWLGLGPADAERKAAYREFALRRQEAWMSDVVRPGREPAAVGYARRPTRPDGARVAEDVPVFGRVSFRP